MDHIWTKKLHVSKHREVKVLITEKESDEDGEISVKYIVSNKIDVGGVNINMVSGTRADHMPYGRFKDSGVGNKGIKYGVEYFSCEMLIGFHWGFTDV